MSGPDEIYDRGEGARGGLAPEPALDLEQLLRRCMNDRDLAAELLSAFRDQSLTLVRRLGDAGEAGLEARADLAHRLKGSALAVGAGAVARAAEAAERAGRRGSASPANAAEMSQAIVKLAEAVVEAAAEIDRLGGRI